MEFGSLSEDEYKYNQSHVLMFPSHALILFTSLLFKPLILSINSDRYFVTRETLLKSGRELQHEEPYQTH